MSPRVRCPPQGTRTVAPGCYPLDMNRRVLPILLLLPLAFARAEGEEAPTALVPETSPFVLRIAAIDRIDAMASEAMPLLKPLLPKDALAEGATVSSLALSQLNPELKVDRTRPIYLGMGKGNAFWLIPAGEMERFEGTKPASQDVVAMLRDGFLCVGAPADLEAKPRGKAVTLLPGDLSMRVFIADLVASSGMDFETMMRAGAMQQMKGMPLPAEATRAMDAMFGLMSGFVHGIDTLDYAVTWREGTLDAQGLLSTREGSGMRTFLSAAGPGGENQLAGFLPRNALIVVDSVTDPAWPALQMQDFLVKAVGPGMAELVKQGMGSWLDYTGAMTGRSASAIAMPGMMSVTAQTIYELKEGADLREQIRTRDFSAINEVLKTAGTGISMRMEPAAAKHGETEMHRIAMVAENVDVAMYAGMFQMWTAIEGRYLLTVMSPTGESDLRGLIDTVRAGHPADNPHMAAMKRYGAGRNIGISMNIGAIKPMAMMMGMFAPEAAKMAMALPDEMLLSTAMSFAGGNVAWRGNWPAADFMKLAAAIPSGDRPGKPAEPGKPEPEDFE